MSSKVNNAFDLIRKEIAIKRTCLANLDEALFPSNEESHPKACSCIAINGNESSGKTSILSYLLCRVLTPHEAGGKHSRVIFIDLKHKLKPENLLSQIDSLLKQNQFTESDHDELIALDCLNAIVYMPCFSADEFAIALVDVEHILLEDINSEIGFIAIDGLDAFYWLDVYEKKQRMRTHYTNLIDKLRSICLANNVSCCHTVNSKYLEVKGANFEENAGVDYHLIVSKNANDERRVNGRRFQVTNNGIMFC